MRLMIKLIIIILIITKSLCYAGNIHDSVSDSKYLEYGKKYPCLVPVFIKKNKSVVGSGSGTIIHPNFIITAAHVVCDKDVDVSINYNNLLYKIDKIIIHPDFDQSFAKNDIALLKTTSNMDIKSIPELYSGRDEIKKLSAIGGYGVTGKGSTGYRTSDNKLRVGTNRIDYIRDNLLCCSFSKGNRSVLEFIITPGDSGGGLFINGKLAGINSCIMASDGKANGNFGDESGHTRISDFISWIELEINHGYIYGL